MGQEEQPPSCYRHPGTPTGIRCARCERPICPECMIGASVGFQCPECVRGGSGTGRAGSADPRTLAGGRVAAGDPQLVTKILIGINALVFLAGLIVPGLLDRLDLIGLAWSPSLGEAVGVADGEWYRLVTAVFLHQEIWHFALNMLGLWWLGGPLEAALGRVRYLALYLLSGLAGSAFFFLEAAPNEPSLGASGAIFGLLGATVVLLRRLAQDMRPVLTLLVLNLVLTFFWEGIAWQAHVGGLVAGALIGYGMVNGPRRLRGAFQWGACGLVAAAVLVTVLLRTFALS
ncbi:rhomboid family intramembrane serine protease [Streptomyces sp. LP05-1]|uniref:Rhomboid family intramembrane serine protease n=1 Tax=Streptomyces pyxinae TaxID=2970734 RepID=A0ABT2CCX9_9ACTN|nr:rhomboid family intramembrane serine protease [Streptomyces sp. LP05-1]MCS0635226.1 rhomboid family intramembrane serine protease [Streptomyces sp. LP05-1]